MQEPEGRAAEIARLKEESVQLKETLRTLGAVVNVEAADRAQGIDLLVPGWVEHVDEAGRVYYGNTLTRQTSWTKPTLLSVQKSHPSHTI